VLRAALQLVLLGVLFALCRLVVARTGLPVPPGLLALVLLIVLLLTRAVPEGAVSRGADALLRILPLLFVAPGIGVIRELHLVSGHGLGLAAVLVVSLVVGQLVAGVVAEGAVRRERR
jgi:holin-like protein